MAKSDKNRTQIVIKLSGEFLIDKNTGILSLSSLKELALQIIELSQQYQFSFVMGGGNFWRGSIMTQATGIRSQASHEIGMYATYMNGMILQDTFEQMGIDTALLTAGSASGVGDGPINQRTIHRALTEGKTILCAGGTGNPYFTTDTAAVIRACQLGAQQVWKLTTIDGIYSQDPKKDPHAQLLKTVSYTEALEKKYGIMDQTAYSIAEQNKLIIRIVYMYHPQVLLKLATDKYFGSIIGAYD